MREFSMPLAVDVPSTGSLVDDIVRNAEEHPDRPSFSCRLPDGWAEVTARQFLDEVRAVAKGLIAGGVAPGDRVALISRTRYEWTLLDYAIWFAGAVTVPMYETSSTDQIGWIVADSGASLALVETAQHAGRVEDAGRDTESLRILCLEDQAIGKLTSEGQDVSDEELDRRRERLGPDSLATIVYTSGTTAEPKGCMLSHGNFMFELQVATSEFDELFGDDDASTLLFLPLAHIFARIVQIGAVKAGVKLGYSSDVRHLRTDLESFRPSFIMAVPRVLEKLFNTLSQEAAAEGRSASFGRAAQTAIAFSEAEQAGRVPLLLRSRHRLFDRLVYRRLRESLGGRCRHAISGGAPLGDRLVHFYRGVGIDVLEGYGLTETTAAVTVNRPGAVRVGTVGQPLPGTTLRVDDDGQLLVRGPQVFGGYWPDRDASPSSLTPDGWLRTGDLGEIDQEGFVRVTGRCKEMIITAGGKNVSPQALEERIRMHDLVSQCLVVGDGRPFIAALITLDREAVKAWATRAGKPDAMETLAQDGDLRAEIQSAVDGANRIVSQAESIRRFALLPEEWTEEAGEVTPSLKLRRHVIFSRHRSEIEDLYRPSL